MDERGYDEIEILSIVDCHVPVLIHPYPNDETVDLYYGKVGDKYLLVPVNKYTNTLIIVRPMRKKEKQAYIEEINDE